MKYAKPAISLETQADLLIGRGMGGDRDLIVARLASVSYYRLSGYWFPFRNPDGTFKAGTSFNAVWDRYAFDRRLRLLVIDAIERVEIAVRTQLACHHSLRHGPFAYATDPASLPRLDAARRHAFVARVEEESSRSREAFVEHFRKKYGDCHAHLPVWTATEIMTFGTVLTFFRGVSQDVKRSISRLFGVPDVVFDSWLLALNAVRNICAHHGRLWNRELGVKPKLPYPKKYPQWHVPVHVANNRVFVVLTICRWCLKHVAPQSRWAERLRALLDESPHIPISSMGFPANWQQCPIWIASP